MHRIVIVGGGAGGLELATRLGDAAQARAEREFSREAMIDRYANVLERAQARRQ